ncbi:MAG: hypothetical protein ACOVLB_06195 [Candidatus Nanopelagicus sp.]
MGNKGYQEIRDSCLLIDYEYKFAAKYALWIEVYQDRTHEYRALFSPQGTSLLPLTITKVLLNEPQRFDYC